MDWKTLLACITGSMEEQCLLRNAYVIEENRSLRNQRAGRVQLTDAERQTLAAIGKKLGKRWCPISIAQLGKSAIPSRTTRGPRGQRPSLGCAAATHPLSGERGGSAQANKSCTSTS